MADDPDSLEPGALFAGRYRVGPLLGRGGTGTVYQVQDERTARPLALKLLQIRRSGPASVSAGLFEREYHTLCQLAHPHIIEVYDYGVDAGRGYYTMELLDGLDMQSLGVLPFERACTLLCEVASSLAIVHSRRFVHRDISARNVRCTTDGHAKLLDFGAMIPMGNARHIVGTPPYLAPEALELQGLDGRADLYALGALAYFALTGYHAYEARTFQGLAAMWNSPPMPPSQLAEGIPPALDQLVMELLQLDRNARPSTAAEVMERLCGIADLPLLELPQVKRSYLVMPSLVGRDAPLHVVRRALAATLSSGQGASLCIEGEPGVGRSRFLDACVLEARLLGMLVLRGDATDSAEAGDYGLIKALCAQLVQAQPELCERALERDDAALLRRVLPAQPVESELDEDSAPLSSDPEAAFHTDTPSRRPSIGVPPAALSGQRDALLQSLRDLFLSAARVQPVLIAVDDTHAVDEPSRALLGMLAQLLRQRPLVLITTSDGSLASGPAFTLLRETATVTRLVPLDPEQNEALLRSVFGDVANIAPLAATVFEIASGNPRSTMTLAEELIAHGLAHYEAGSWTLPAQLQAADLPSSATAALLGRLRELSADARELAEVLALSDSTRFSLDCLPMLCGHGDVARAYRALDELVAAAVLERSGDRCRFAQRALPETLERNMSDAGKRSVHERFAQLLQSAPPDLTVARHCLLGGRELQAIECLRTVCLESAFGEPAALPLLQLALEAAERVGADRESRLDLRVATLQAASISGRRDLFLAHAPEVLAQCERDTGLRAYRDLGPEWQGEARLKEALKCTARVSPSTSPDSTEARFRHVYGAYHLMGGVGQELELLELLPPLDAFFEHFPSWKVSQASAKASRYLLQGRTTAGMRAQRAQLRWLDEADVSRLDPKMVSTIRRGAQLWLAMFAATSGQAKVGELIAELEQLPGHRSHAWRVRMVYELMHGNLAAAADCRRSAELFNLQDSGKPQFAGSTVRIELLAQIYADSLLGVKRAMEPVAGLAARLPGWRPTLAIARCHYRRLQGDARAALAELEPALSLEAGRHLDWWLMAYSHIKALCDAERCEEAVAHGERYLKTWNDEQLSSVDYGLAQVTAEALARVGRLQEARRLIDHYIAMHDQVGTRGLRLGLAYETAARIALAAGDDVAVRHYCALCNKEYKGGRDPLLRAKLAQLQQDTGTLGEPPRYQGFP